MGAISSIENWDVVGCPQCGGSAEIVDRFVLASTDGPTEHVKIWCLHRHWFLLPVDRCSGRGTQPQRRSDVVRDPGM